MSAPFCAGKGVFDAPSAEIVKGSIIVLRGRCPGVEARLTVIFVFNPLSPNGRLGQIPCTAPLAPWVQSARYRQIERPLQTISMTGSEDLVRRLRVGFSLSLILKAATRQSIG
jgi:hypothetical protein